MKMNSQEVRQFFDDHWTVRKYKDLPMPPEDLETILHAAHRAPTDATAQMYSLIRLVDSQLRIQVSELSDNPHIASASEAFIVCGDVHRLRKVLELEGFKLGQFPHIAIHFAIGDAVLAGQSMLLAAEMLGYRGCWIGGVLSEPKKISEILRLPEGVFPFAGLTIGVPDEEPKHRPRLPREQLIHTDSYQEPTNEELRKGVDKMASITQRGNWANTLNRYFGEGGSMEQRELKLQSLLIEKIAHFTQ